jgi:hypothetical protein
MTLRSRQRAHASGVHPARSNHPTPTASRQHRGASGLFSVALLALLIGGCSGPSEDVRITLCKDLVRVQLGASPTWTQASTQTPGYQDAVVRLRWDGAGGAGQARCQYAYNAVEDTAQQLADPLSAYAASPNTVVINGQTLSGQALASAIGQAMALQGKQLIDSASQILQQ